MSKHTPGPWYWTINKSTKSVRLLTPKGGRLIVMDFVRYGLRAAAPRFRSEDCLMDRADELSKIIPGEEHHAEWNQDIDHPDARLIAQAPAMLECLKLALNDSGCDGDLCCHEWHEKARAIIRAAEGE